MINKRHIPILFWILLLGLYSGVSAHEDLDLAVVDVTFDTSCFAQITLENQGRTLPLSFYRMNHAAHILIQKGEQKEVLDAIQMLDSKRQLQKRGGKLTVRSRTAFANNPSPIAVDIAHVEEFVDHQPKNNQYKASLDCRVGLGVVEGEPLPVTQPDVAITALEVDKKRCTYSVTLENLTEVALPESAWGESGVSLEQFNESAHEKVLSTPLRQVDSQRAFTRKLHELQIELAIPQTDAQRWRVSVWAVPNDLNFQNNHWQFDIPDTCQTLNNEH